MGLEAVGAPVIVARGTIVPSGALRQTLSSRSLRAKRAMYPEAQIENTCCGILSFVTFRFPDRPQCREREPETINSTELRTETNYLLPVP